MPSFQIIDRNNISTTFGILFFFVWANGVQGDVAASVLSDIVTAVINGSDGCVFCFGHAQLGKCSFIH